MEAMHTGQYHFPTADTSDAFLGRTARKGGTAMPAPRVILQNVTFRYEGASHPLFDRLEAHLPSGWTGIVGVNGCGKTTLLRLATGGILPQTGRVIGSGDALYCEQRTDLVPRMLGLLLASTEGRAKELRGRLAVEDDWETRWDTLSHGERKRAQIAAALWKQPSVLAVDEPTNHLDAEAQGMLTDALDRFQGVGLLVSHDRNLLDRLCSQCLFVDPPECTVRPGGVTAGMAQAATEGEAARREKAQAGRSLRRLEREAAKRRDSAAQQQRKRSKRGLGNDNDARHKRNLARITGRDGTGGRLLRQLDGRLDQARKRRDATRVKKAYELGIWIPGERSRRDLLFRLPGRDLDLGGGRRLRHTELSMVPDDRVALCGPNGTGKSTLVRSLVCALNVPEDRLTYVPQEIDAPSARAVLDEARSLPGDRLGCMMTAVSRLGSRPERLLESENPSPGEVRKLMLATGIARMPHLIVMDEPTNHLDLQSIQCLEAALDGCPCGLLLVSHDQRFLDSLTRRRWCIARDSGAEGLFALSEDYALRVGHGR